MLSVEPVYNYEVEWHCEGKNREATYWEPAEHAELVIDGVYNEAGINVMDELDDATMSEIAQWCIDYYEEA